MQILSHSLTITEHLNSRVISQLAVSCREIQPTLQPNPGLEQSFPENFPFNGAGMRGLRVRAERGRALGGLSGGPRGACIRQHLCREHSSQSDQGIILCGCHSRLPGWGGRRRSRPDEETEAGSHRQLAGGHWYLL